jgi:outer membrane protein assembly factor BamB
MLDMTGTNASNKAMLRSGILNVAYKLGVGVDVQGKLYTWMFDTRELLLTYPYLQIMGAMLWERLKPYQPSMVGGMTLAANPLTAAVLYEAWRDGCPLNGFLIRKEPKENGLRKLIEGPVIQPGTRIVLVDDMVNSGTTQRKALRALAPFRPDILAIGTVLNTELAGQQWLEARGVRVEALFTLAELGAAARPESRPGSAALAWRYGPLNTGTHTAPHSAPVIEAGRIVVGSNGGHVVCLNLTGDALWRFETRVSRNGIHSTPVLRDGKIWVGAYDGYVYCLDAETGSLLWERRVAQWVGSSPALHGGTLFIGGEVGEGGGSLIALQADTGELLWETRLNHFVHSSPCADRANGRVIVGCNDGNVYACDLETGVEAWRFNTNGPVKAGPTLDGQGNCFFCSADGLLYALKAQSGTLAWSRRIGRSAYFRPLVLDALVIAVGSSGRVVACDAASGLVQWVATVGGNVVGGAAATGDGRILLGAKDGCMTLLDGTDGDTLWRYRTGGPITVEPAIRDNLAVLPSRDGYLYAVNL